jgi:antitoxin HicB
MAKHKHIGSSFDSFLDEEGIRAEVHAEAAKRVFAWQLRKLMKERGVSESKLARLMGLKGRATVQRLLDPEQTSATLGSMVRAADAVGARLKIQVVAAPRRERASRRSGRAARVGSVARVLANRAPNGGIRRSR